MSEPTKRQYLPESPTLWVVATPIGNLEDLSPRARSVLEAATRILCEDTRRGRSLLSAVGLPAKPLERVDAHASAGWVEKLVARLAEGDGPYAFVTDAGTPGISDPASMLARAARAAGVSVVPVPGPSALTALLSVAGFDEPAFTFHGFFPRKKGEREGQIQAVSRDSLVRVHCWFESPHRIREALEAVCAGTAGAELAVAKELTKLHERVWAGESAEVLRCVGDELDREGEKGEWCFAVRLPASARREVPPAGGAESETPCWRAALECLVEAGVSPSKCAKIISQRFGVARSDAYSAVLSAGDSKEKQK